MFVSDCGWCTECGEFPQGDFQEWTEYVGAGRYITREVCLECFGDLDELRGEERMLAADYD